MNNTVDVSPERIAAEFSAIRAEAGRLHPPVDTTSPNNVTGNVNNDVKRESEVTIGAGGFEIPDLPTGDLCCFGGAIAANMFAPNWVANGLTDQHIESIARPLGAVVDKYLDKYFPDQKLGTLIEPYKEELFLLYSTVTVISAFANVPRQLPIAINEGDGESEHQAPEPVKDPEIHTDFDLGAID